uniref:Uncharacterized protein n=1 Tax=Nyssomyia neivai TaxID=330878 RepID=A0A1L8DDH3_9DIPT
MDLLRRILGLNPNQENGNDKKKPPRDDFRKPIWFEENETDDELFDNGKFFGPHIFANPMELEKHFEKHLQDLLKSFDDFESSGEPMKEDFGKFPSIWGSLESKANGVDRDLDSEVNSGKLKTILDSVPKVPTKKRLSDEEMIMARIHGTDEKKDEPRRLTKPRYVPKMTPMHPNFESSVPIPGAKIFGQSIMTETVRKPDGTVESRRVVRDFDGNLKTTISRTVDGETKIVTTFNGEGERDKNTRSNGNFFVTPNGYTLPRNLW